MQADIPRQFSQAEPEADTVRRPGEFRTGVRVPKVGPLTRPMSLAAPQISTSVGDEKQLADLRQELKADRPDAVRRAALLERHKQNIIKEMAATIADIERQITTLDNEMDRLWVFYPSRRRRIELDLASLHKQLRREISRRQHVAKGTVRVGFDPKRPMSHYETTIDA